MGDNAGHEPDRVSTAAVVRFGIGLALMLIVAAAVLAALFSYFKSRVPAQAAVAPANVELRPPPQAPEPRLLRNEPANLAQVRADEDRILHGYAWVDPDKGIVRIPIDRAMEVLAERGEGVKK